MEKEKIKRLVIVGSNFFEMEGLRALLEEKAHDIKTLRKKDDVVGAVLRLSPEIVVLDAEAPGLKPQALTTRIRGIKNPPKVIWLVNDRDLEVEIECLLSGGDGCVSKMDPDLLFRAIEVIRGSELFFSRRAIAKILKGVTALPKFIGDKVNVLSVRERQILNLVVQGLTNDDIAEKLYISPETVKTHLKNIRRKLGIRSRRQLTYS